MPAGAQEAGRGAGASASASAGHPACRLERTRALALKRDGTPLGRTFGPGYARDPAGRRAERAYRPARECITPEAPGCAASHDLSPSCQESSRDGWITGSHRRQSSLRRAAGTNPTRRPRCTRVQRLTFQPLCRSRTGRPCAGPAGSWGGVKSGGSRCPRELRPGPRGPRPIPCPRRCEPERRGLPWPVRRPG